MGFSFAPNNRLRWFAEVKLDSSAAGDVSRNISVTMMSIFRGA